MSTEPPDEKIELSEPVPRRFARLILNFFVGLAVGLAPFLGTQNVPFFKALISVMPFQIRNELIVFSAFLMGLIVAAVQFYASERIARTLLRKLFRLALIVIAAGFVLFFVLLNEFTVKVPRGERTVTVLIGSEPLSDCRCPDPARNPEICIAKLSFNPTAIAQCWNRKEIRRRGELLGLAYLFLTGGVGVLVGFILVQEGVRRQEKNEKARKSRKRSRPANLVLTAALKTEPAPGSSPPSGSPEPPAPGRPS